MKSLPCVLLALVMLAGCAAVPGAREPVATGPAVAEAARPSPESSNGVALELPATFADTLPCADCPGIRMQVTLWPDGVFELRRDWLDRDFSVSDVGRWRSDPQQRSILLHGATEMPLRFGIEDPRTIRQLDVLGRRIDSTLPYELRSDGAVHPFALRLRMIGAFSYLADAARLRECISGRTWPVAMEGAYIELERAYKAAPGVEPGAPWAVAIEARIEERPAMDGGGLEPTVLVDRFDGEAPLDSCVSGSPTATLPNTYWLVLELAGERVTVAGEQREPHLILRDDELRYSATAGCNRLLGDYEVSAGHIAFRNGVSTRMACPPPLAGLEDRLLRVLAETSRWRILGQTLEFMSDSGDVIAVFEAVYLR